MESLVLDDPPWRVSLEMAAGRCREAIWNAREGVTSHVAVAGGSMAGGEQLLTVSLEKQRTSGAVVESPEGGTCFR